MPIHPDLKGIDEKTAAKVLWGERNVSGWED
jgi:hypothetical protein